MTSRRPTSHMCVRTIRERLGVKACRSSCRSARRPRCKGIVDLVRMKGGGWYGTPKAWARTTTTKRSGPDLEGAVRRARHYMIEKSVELDDEAMEAYLSGEEPRSR